MKRFLSILLAIVLAIPAFSVSAEIVTEEFADVQVVLAQLGVMEGYPDGTFRPENPVTRAEFAKIAIMASAYRDYVASGMNTSPFSDVSFKHWAAPYIRLASANKLVTGYPDSTFRPEENVLMEEAVTVAVKMLGYTDEDTAASWPYGHIGIATNIGLLNGVNNTMGVHYTREDVAKLIYNTLRAKPKNAATPSAEYINSLGYSFVENVTILATSEQDSMVPAGKVSTSNGTYKINEYFDHDIIGETGDIMINSDSNELLLFFGKYVTTVEYVFSSVVDGNIIAYKDGELVSLKLSDNLNTYYKLSTYQLGSIRNQFKEGDILSIAYDEHNNIEYLSVNKGDGYERVESLTTIEYRFSSVIDGKIVAYQGDDLLILNFSDSTPAYYNNNSTTIGSVKNSIKEGASISVAYAPDGEVKYLDIGTGELSGSIDEIVEEEYTFYSVLDDEILAYKNGKMVTLKLSDKTPAYYKEQSTTLGSVKNQIEEGYSLKISYDKFGDVRFVLVDKGNRPGFVNDVTEENYSIYSVINNEIMAYKDGKLVSLKLEDDLTVYKDSTTTTYGQIKSSLTTGYSLAVGYDSAKNARYARVVEEKMSGPIVVLDSFNTSKYNLSSNPVVMRDGNKSTASEISKYDVVYYSQSLDTVWAYSKKVSGTFESASPSRDNVTSVTIAGKTYNVETADASIALSSSGDFVLGDTVTVLLGKNGEIAGVVKPEDVSSAVFGYLKSVGKTEFININGDALTSYYAEVVHVDGSVVRYKTDKEYDMLKNSVVTLTFDDGIATVTKFTQTETLSGVVDADKLTLGDSKIAKNISILEVSTQKNYENTVYSSVFLSKLDGLNVLKTQVLYSKRNTVGEIYELIIINVSGEIYQYGIVENASIKGDTGRYTGFIGTSDFTVSSATKFGEVASGTPVQISSDGVSIFDLSSLIKQSGRLMSLTRFKAVTTEKSISVSEGCLVYDENYNVLPLDELIENLDKYNVSIYIDKYSRIVRVIKAKKK